jgi:hypothetical protein
LGLAHLTGKRERFNRRNESMMYPGEQEAIETVKRLGAEFGYGNLISHLQREWSERHQARDGVSQHTADTAAGIICVWCGIDSRTGKKAKKQVAKRRDRDDLSAKSIAVQDGRRNG